jgi:formylglycine-generating enzyme required for sulfatase activity
MVGFAMVSFARTASVWLGIASLSAVLSTAAAQPCDGVVVNVDANGYRCLKPGAGQSFKDCPDCPEMVVVPAGTFVMGSPAGEQVAVEHEREDTLRVSIAAPFAVGRFAVTRGEFEAFIAATGYKADRDCFRLIDNRWKRDANANWRSPGFAQSDRHPAVCISWTDAQAYASWISAFTGKSYRLLSEAEREHITRAGSTTPFWWGTMISTSQANYDGNITYGGGAKGERRNGTVSVDSFSANPWGLYNVHGNVWEWVEDCWNEKNAGNPADGTARYAGDCSLRVHRGGSWNNAPHTVRSGKRDRNPADYRSGVIGFRVARTLQSR